VLFAFPLFALACCFHNVFFRLSSVCAYSLFNATEAVHDEHYFAGLSLIVLQTYCVQEPLSLIHLNQLFLVRKRMKKVSGLMESEAQHYVIWILMILRLLK